MAYSDRLSKPLLAFHVVHLGRVVGVIVRREGL